MKSTDLSELPPVLMGQWFVLPCCHPHLLSAVKLSTHKAYSFSTSFCTNQNNIPYAIATGLNKCWHIYVNFCNKVDKVKDCSVKCKIVLL